MADAGLQFQNPIVAGTTLVRDAIKSPNYVAGSTGWTINQDGTVEFSNGTFRGQLIAGGGNVILNAGGLAIDGPTTQYDINGVAGFLAQNLPVDGTIAQMSPGALFLTPQDPSPAGVAVDYATVQVGYANSGAVDETPATFYAGVNYTGKSAPSVNLYGQARNDVNPDGTSHADVTAFSINLFADSTNVDHKLFNYDTGMYFCPIQLFTVNVPVTGNGNTGPSNANLGATALPTPITAGRSISGFANNAGAAASSAGWTARYLPVSNTQYNINCFNNAGGAAGSYSIPVLVMVVVIPQ
jgi:hypothetical protein